MWQVKFEFVLTESEIYHNQDQTEKLNKATAEGTGNVSVLGCISDVGFPQGVIHDSNHTGIVFDSRSASICLDIAVIIVLLETNSRFALPRLARVPSKSWVSFICPA